ncbi:MAG: DUF11 domain-containing protein [Woeseia sp.]|nr:DUF11 domain-containing protein [Woeseia sp.]
MDQTLNKAVILSAIAACAIASPAKADGVRAGTLIENTASASYNSGGTTASVDSNTVQLTVDELLDVAVTSLNTAPSDGGSDPVVLNYSVTNTGNGEEAFTLTANPSVPGNDYNTTVDRIAVDSNGNGVYDEGVDAVISPGNATTLIQPDDSLTVFVIVNNPAGVSDGDTSQVSLIAEAESGSGTPGTVFAGQGEGGGDAVVGSSTAQDDAAGTIIVGLADVSLAKSVVVVDPFGGSEAVPGAVLTYSIVTNVSGSGTAEGLRITDVIPGGTSYQNNSLKLDGAPLTDDADADAGQASSAGIDVLLGDVTGGNSKTITFSVMIN